MPRKGVNTRPRMTAAERTEAVVLYATGMSLLEVAAELGRSYGAVHGVIYRAGIMRSQKELPAGTDDRVLALWREHESVTKIVDLVGHCRSAVISSLARSGVTVTQQRRDALRDDERARIIDLYVTEGKKIEDVSAEVGRSPSTVHRALIKANVVRRHAHRRSVDRDADRVTADTTEREVEPMGRRDNDAELEKAWDRRAQDEEAMKRRLPPPQNRAEQQAMRGVRDPGQEDDN